MTSATPSKDLSCDADRLVPDRLASTPHWPHSLRPNISPITTALPRTPGVTRKERKSCDMKGWKDGMWGGRREMKYDNPGMKSDMWWWQVKSDRWLVHALSDTIDSFTFRIWAWRFSPILCYGSQFCAMKTDQIQKITLAILTMVLPIAVAMAQVKEGSYCISSSSLPGLQNCCLYKITASMLRVFWGNRTMCPSSPLVVSLRQSLQWSQFSLT